MSYNYVDPPHYQKFSKDVIDMMVDVWGVDAVILFCEMNSFKYRMRMGHKPSQPIDQEFEKALWYERKREELINNKEKSTIIQFLNKTLKTDG